MHSPDFQLLVKSQRKELTELCPGESEVNQLFPKVLSKMFVEEPKRKKSDSDSDLDEKKTSQFNAKDTTLCAEVAKQVSIRQVESDE